MWLCILSCRPFEDSFENALWRKIKQMQSMWLCILLCERFEDTSENTQWRNKCNQCEFATSYASALRTHLKTHREEKSNKCNQWITQLYRTSVHTDESNLFRLAKTKRPKSDQTSNHAGALRKLCKQIYIQTNCWHLSIHWRPPDLRRKPFWWQGRPLIRCCRWCRRLCCCSCIFLACFQW